LCFLVKGFGRTGIEKRNRQLYGKIRTGVDDKYEVQTSERRDEEKTIGGHSVNRQIEGTHTSYGTRWFPSVNHLIRHYD